MASLAGRLIAVVGPTASGKTGLALQLARHTAAEIVSCDSLQVYRGLDIGSVKPTPEERAAVPHHLIDVAEPDEGFSAARYARLGRAALEQIRARGRLAVVAGGTGLYLRALLYGLFAGPSRDAALRARLDSMAQRFGHARLHRLLARVDAVAATRIDARDGVRIVRALEVYLASGKPISDHHQAGASPLQGFRILVLGLRPDREHLRAAVERRTRAMLEGGLLDEVRGLVARYPSDLAPLRAIGYRQAVAVVEGRLPAQEAERGIVTETMRYAKRQMTWFRHQEKGAVWCATPEEAYRVAVGWLAEA